MEQMYEAFYCEDCQETHMRRRSTRVSVDRARFERLLAVAEAAHEHVNAPFDVSAGSESIALKLERVLTALVDALHPGDLDAIA